MEYTVILHQAEEGGYWVEVPSLPGCFSQGESIDEALKNIKEAVESHLEGLKKEEQEIPEDSGFMVSRIKVTI